MQHRPPGQPPSKPWSLEIMIGAAAVAAVGLIVIFLRPTSPPEEPEGGRPPPQPVARQPLRLSERLRPGAADRPLSADRPPAVQDRRITVPGAVAPAPVVREVPTRALPPAPEMKPESVGDAGSPPEDGDLEDYAEDVPMLTRVVIGDPDPERRLTAVELLGATEDPQVVTVLARALADEDEEVRMAALQALSDFTGETPALAIENALRDPSADIRYEALTMLAEVGGERARGAVERALNDPDEDVRTLAQSLLELQHPEQNRGDPGAAPPPGWQPPAQP
jgi:hypothetical protein